MSQNIIKILLENAPLLGVFILISGSLKVFLYYKLFGIYIFEFIGVNEVLVLIIDNLLAFFYIIIVFFILFIANSYLSGIFPYLVPIFFTTLSLIYLFLRKKVYLYEIGFQNIVFWGFFFITLDQTKFIAQSSNDSIFKNIVLMFFLITLVIYSIFNAINEFHKVKNKQYYSKTKVLFEDCEFVSTKDKYYIGKTKKFVFIHNNKDKSNEAIPVSLVKKITFHKTL